MKIKSAVTIYFLISTLFLFVDQALKYFSRSNSDFSYYIWKSWLGWEYWENAGVAFSIPFPNWLIIILTPIILLGVLYFITKKKRSSIFYLGFFLIFAGAISNYIDRILFGVTIDYLRVFTGIINLADVFIVVGAGVVVFESRKS